jgi:hypothetical protein
MRVANLVYSNMSHKFQKFIDIKVNLTFFIYLVSLWYGYTNRQYKIEICRHNCTSLNFFSSDYDCHTYCFNHKFAVKDCFLYFPLDVKCIN